jgi:hypothetical protein
MRDDEPLARPKNSMIPVEDDSTTPISIVSPKILKMGRQSRQVCRLLAN